MRALPWILTLFAAPALASAGAEAPCSGPSAGANLQETVEWRERLADPDLARREKAYERLIQAVRQNPALAGMLREWAEDEGSGELAWTARLALRELKKGPSAGPWGHFHWMPGPQDWPWGDGWPIEALPGPSARRDSAFESFQLDQGPDGVRIRVETEVDGERETKTYEGETLEAILEANPELGEKLHAGGGFHNLRQLPREPVPWGAWPRRGEESVAPEPLPTDVLGVYVREPTGAERARAGLSEGGLAIERVAEGTIAEVLGLQAGSIITEINGRAVDERDAISAALAERTPEGELRIELYDSFGRRQTRTWRPAPPPPDAQARGAGL
jgi:hypothetical protein